MQSVLIVIHLMVVIALVVTVLLQRSEGGAIGIGGGGGFMTGRGQANALTRATAILAAMFFATSLGLTFLARLNQAPEVIFQSVTPVEPSGSGAAKEKGKGSLLDQLQRMEDQTSKPPAIPPGVSLPGQGVPAESESGPSIVETVPAGQSPKLPLPALPSAPVVPPASEPAPAKPLPYKAEPPPPALPAPK
ncbi:MAG TPA: preprotein translocase subunit SecG [Methylocella sp.]|nr:preprotein translocase subunit SecG [Methylocella sp.]